MAQTPINELLQQLRSREPEKAWALFLEEYANLVFQIVRHFEQNADDTSDCFQFVCERMCEDRFRRLRRFKLDGPAKFQTWLRAVVRNLCLDWHRKQFGRRRVFRSIARLSDLDQEIFRLVHERGATEEEALVALASRFPHLTPALVSEAIERVNKTLTTNQNWLLRARSAVGQSGSAALDDPDHAEVADSQSNPEAVAILKERRVMLIRAVSRLPNKQRLLIRLRFEEELTLEQIASLLELGNAQRVDRQIKQILSSLRNELASANPVGGKKSPSSVEVG